MISNEIMVEVVRVEQSKCQQPGDTFIIGNRTPSGMCCRAFHAIYPSVVAMRFSEACSWEEDGHLDVTCPDGFVTYRLKRNI